MSDQKSRSLSTSLRQAIETRRVAPLSRIDEGQRVQTSKAASKTIIRYPKAAEALRRHVNEVATAKPVRSSFRLAPVLPVSPPPVQPRLPLPPPAEAVLPGATSSATRRGRLLQPSQVGGLVRARRDDLRMSQKDLALAAGVGRRFVSELEAGKATVELGKVLLVCRALGLTLFAAADTDG